MKVYEITPLSDANCRCADGPVLPDALRPETSMISFNEMAVMPDGDSPHA
jgi:hypothetical protein